ncbi:MAG TPA: methyltransferase domain-containing protein [Herpetosiphonaceae bacterium]|jgi:SAM-dependent methyltransferase|nr:methyltransferase domain-containing protein [Herpetosiphonaceae bacterium]
MNTSSDFETQTTSSMTSPLQLVLTTSLAQEAHDVVRHLGRVLDIQKDDHVLLIPGDGVLTALTLVNEFGCRVSVLTGPHDEHTIQPADERIDLEAGSLTALPFESATFDAVIVSIPVVTGLQRVARELSRVLNRSGRLGMVALSLYRDQVADEAGAVIQQSQGGGQIRPAAAYRAVLAEAGFTAFLSEDRRRELRRSAQAIYREHMLEPGASHRETLGLLAAGGVSMTLITAEKGF